VTVALYARRKRAIGVYREVEMRYSAEHKEETRRKILDAAARRFRAEGYEGLGVDGLAKAAGVTNGAFYGHFASKADAYRAVVEAGLQDLREGIERFRRDHGADWLAAFTAFYFSPPKIGCAEAVCGLPAFAPEAARAPAETREAFQSRLLQVVEAVADGLEGPVQTRFDRAWRVLAVLAGGVTLARAVPDEDLARQIADALTPVVVKLGRGD
jgi:AcrR family transcriptional regulator